MSQPIPIPPGWYSDPSQPGQLRWWNGTQWTSEIAVNPASNPNPAQAGTPSTPPMAPGALEGSPATPPPVAAAPDRRHGLFGGKRELEAEVAQLRSQLAALGIPERDALRAELTNLRSDVPSLTAERLRLLNQVEPLRVEVARLQQEAGNAKTLLEQVTQLQATKTNFEAAISQMQPIVAQASQAKVELDELKRQVVETRDTAILQEVGIYQYHHPLEDSPAYKVRLTAIQAQIKDAVRAGNAVVGSTTWTVNGSARDGTRMVREFSKLMLRAYNNEADNAVRSMKPYTLESSVARLEKARATIVKLGGTMNIRVQDHYHQLRVQELELTADYLAKVAEEKERDREIRERAREDEIARREFEREQARLSKEREHYRLTLEALRQQGDEEAAAKAESKINEIQDAIDGITRRAANTRAGSVYIISNVGAFGPKMVKVGMTRRLDPMDRVRELGDASVPFRYDVHAIIPSDDAVGLETHLHHSLAQRRVNMVNARKEFFLAHPSEVRILLEQLGESILHWEEEPIALEWRQSETARRSTEDASAPGTLL